MKRTRVTLSEAIDNVPALVARCNEAPGPIVAWDEERHCYGLRADKDYRVGERVTTYNGHKSVKRGDQRGDYVAESGDIIIDGLFDFLPEEKGRWINESDRQRSVVNVNLARTVRATQRIFKGEWLFADYGIAYQRLY